MNSLLQPFDEADRYLIRSGLEALQAAGFFHKYAELKTLQLIQRFESIPKDDRIDELNRLAAIRSELLYLANESATLAGETKDSKLTETQNEQPVE